MIPTVLLGTSIDSEACGACKHLKKKERTGKSALTDKGNRYERYPNATIEPDDSFFPIHDGSKPRHTDGRFCCL